MKMQSDGLIKVYILNQAEWMNFSQLNPNPSSLGIKVMVMSNGSRKIIISKSESFKITRFEAALSAAQIIVEK